MFNVPSFVALNWVKIGVKVIIYIFARLITGKINFEGMNYYLIVPKVGIEVISLKRDATVPLPSISESKAGDRKHISK
jgi:hypothetical protein